MRTPSRWTLRRRVTALCVIVGLVLGLLAAGAAVVATDNRQHLDTLLNKTGPLRTDGQALLSTLVDQQGGVRGFAVTANDADLAPYREGVRREAALIASMDALLDDQPEIRRELYTVRDHARQWRAVVAEPAIELTTGSGPEAAQEFLTTQTGARFTELRGEVEALQGSILELRNSVAENARRTGNALVLLLVLAAIVVVLAGLALLTSLNRLVIGPVTTLAAQVREVAGGAYQREIEQVGPPELAALAGDVDGMRRRIAADLAEVRQARERIEWVNSQLEKQAEELVRSNRDLEQFAYVASHDLQEPLRKVASFCQLLQRRYAGKLDERADQYIAFAVDGAQRMQRLINDLLAFSRIGRITSGFGDVDLNAVMTEVAAQTENTRRYVGGELTWSELPVIRGEETLLINLLANLVGNSLKFRRPDVPPKVHVSARLVGDEWEISCQDNGIGIESEFADKIFVIFQRLHAKDAYPGTGIGLAIVKKIVEYHGGRVWVEPGAVAEGTVIRFTLPVPPELRESAAPAEAGGAEAGAAEADAVEATAPAVPAQAAESGSGDSAGAGSAGAEPAGTGSADGAGVDEADATPPGKSARPAGDMKHTV
ncbi:ATP-binding protein [Micromonospora sp. WMMD1102]|uniref:sensor histidine kinase n=1 Tax=Micromonospora sp. WMMD1102 TaxID=3016105 RepID=UPI0024156275|nr:sensor histidine kinase [Micromonospora sp. WMMD1102]MDG4790093.1 ATP-binding protein [Micromonospora sp. WMMD1102]